MARTLDEEFYDPVPGYTPDPYKRRPTPAPADVPRGGQPVPPVAPLSDRPLFPGDERDNVLETYADPLSATRSMRYGLGDERDLGAPVVDPRSPSAPSPARWGSARYVSPDSVKVPEITDWDRRLARSNGDNIGESAIGDFYHTDNKNGTELIPEEYIRRDKDGSWVDLDIAKNRVAEYDAAMARRAALGPEGVRIARDSNGGYAYAHGRPVADQTTPRPLFSGVAGEDFEATRRRGEQVARLMRETDGPFANPNDWNYVRSYGPRAAAQAVASGRANISGAPPELVAQERERFLRNRTTDLSISPQLRSAARDELAQIERDAAEERRREMWAAEQAARLRMAEGANAATVEAARLTADGQIRAAQAKAAADAAAAEAAGKGKPVQLDPESPGLYVDGTFWKNPAYNPKPVTAGGNGIGRWNPDTGSWDFEWPDKGGAKKAPVTLKPGESYFDPETKETFVAPGTDRISIEAEIAGWQSAYVKADGSKARAEIEKRIDEARKRLAALGGGEAAPAAPAPAPASPTGHRRWTPGS